MGRRRRGRRRSARSAAGSRTSAAVRLAARRARSHRRMTESPYVLAAEGQDVFRTFVIPIPDRSARATCARSSSGRATRGSCTTRTSASTARARRARLDAADPEPGYVGRHGAGRQLPARLHARLDAGTASAAVARRHAVAARARQRSRRPAAPAADRQARTGAGQRRAVLHRRAADARADRPSARQRDDRHSGRRPPVRRSPTATRCPSTPICWPSSRTRTTSPAASRRRRACPTARRASSSRSPTGISGGRTSIATRGRSRCREGTTIVMRFAYDNSAANPRNPHQPPRRVVWGQNTIDEMGDLWLQLVPRRRERFRRAGGGDHAEDAHGGSGGVHARSRRRKRPTRCATTSLARCTCRTAARRKPREFLAESLRLNPASAPTHYNLGLALSMMRRFYDAEDEFQEAVRLDPGARRGAQQPRRDAPRGRRPGPRRDLLPPGRGDSAGQRGGAGTTWHGCCRRRDSTRPPRPSIARALALRPDMASALCRARLDAGHVAGSSGPEPGGGGPGGRAGGGGSRAATTPRRSTPSRPRTPRPAGSTRRPRRPAPRSKWRRAPRRRRWPHRSAPAWQPTSVALSGSGSGPRATEASSGSGSGSGSGLSRAQGHG